MADRMVEQIRAWAREEGAPPAAVRAPDPALAQVQRAPSSAAEAAARQADYASAARRIDRQLATAAPERFPTADAYRAWRTRAEVARERYERDAARMGGFLEEMRAGPAARLARLRGAVLDALAADLVLRPCARGCGRLATRGVVGGDDGYCAEHATGPCAVDPALGEIAALLEGE